MSDKVVFVTGAGRGLGKAVVERFLQDGYRVLALDSHAENLAASQAEWNAGERVIARVADVRQRPEIEQALDAALSAWGRVDVLANIAGIAAEEEFLSISPESWQRIIDINLTGSFHVAQIVARQMAQQGSGVILNMASKNGLTAEVKYAHYNASKAGIILLTQSMAIDLAPYGIRVNAIAPGYIVTPLSAGMDSPEFMAYYRHHLIPLGRLGEPRDVSGAFAFLASDDARFITGHTLVLDGGQLSHDGRLLHSFPPKP